MTIAENTMILDLMDDRMTIERCPIDKDGNTAIFVLHWVYDSETGGWDTDQEVEFGQLTEALKYVVNIIETEAKLDAMLDKWKPKD